MLDNFSLKDIIKYLIVIGILYIILKVLPSQKLNNKDILLLLFVIILIFVTIDYKCFKNNNLEPFSVDNKQLDLPDKQLQSNLMSREQMLKEQLVKEQMSREKMLKDLMSREQMSKEQMLKEQMSKEQMLKEQIPNASTMPQNQHSSSITTGCSTAINEMQTQIDLLKNQLVNNTNNNTGQKYFDVLLNDLQKLSVLSNTDVQNINNKIKLKLLTLDEAISSLETLKKSNVVSEEKTDLKYNELPSGYFTPIGDKIANEWDMNDSLLNTDKWTVPMPRPPVCINNSPCTVCPSNDSNIVSLKNWDDSRRISNTSLNKKWTDNQTNSTI